MIVYDKRNGNIIRQIPKDQRVEVFFRYYPEDIKSNLETLKLDNYPRSLKNYKVLNGKLVKRSEEEISELRIYNRLLTPEERQLQKLKPSPEEVKKAENTIEILTLIQEVI